MYESQKLNKKLFLINWNCLLNSQQQQKQSRNETIKMKIVASSNPTKLALVDPTIEKENKISCLNNT